ncbi:MAG TPA: hypothetical protein VNG33_12390 [Polyangiaceae bacterium]|nr:hypothetical protein [Polyangiaceae bacterium]
MAIVAAEIEFVRMLGQLEKDAFQDAVCRFLRGCISDFQDIPTKPQGDASLDGHSDGQTIVYCCYGPEQEPFKKNTKGLKSDIIKKFRGDLSGIFEVVVRGKGNARKIVEAPNKEMATVLAPGKKITLIRLIVSVFETHQILSPLNGTFEEFRAASKRQYVADDVKMTLWGPKQLLGLGPVDDLTILRFQEAEMLRRVDAAMSGGGTTPLPTASDFEAKFDALAQGLKGNPEKVERLRKHFRQQWSRAIELENDLANNAVVLHRALSRARERAAVDADLASGRGLNAMQLLAEMRDTIGTRLDEQTGVRFPPEVRLQVADGEVGRLIGECPIDWRESK